MKSLDLRDNSADINIKSGSFNGLHNLNTLILYNSKIKNLIAPGLITTGLFKDLKKLDYLDLYGNKITTIEPGTFNGLDNLNYLDLGSNGITKIKPGAFNGLRNLKTLILSNNSILLSSSNFKNKTKNVTKENSYGKQKSYKVLNTNISQLPIFKGLPSNTEIHI